MRACTHLEYFLEQLNIYIINPIHQVRDAIRVINHAYILGLRLYLPEQC
jgi:hypothetical protein